MSFDSRKSQSKLPNILSKKESRSVNRKSRSKSSRMSVDVLKSMSKTGKKLSSSIEESSSSRTNTTWKDLMRHFVNECGTDLRCHCVKCVLLTRRISMENVAPTVTSSSDSSDQLDKRLLTPSIPLSIAERRVHRMEPIKLYKKRVDRAWHKRYNYVLPEDQQFDIQPYDEIQARDEEIAVEFFYGSITPSWLCDGSKEAADLRARILHRYNREKRAEEEALTAVCPTITHTRVESIISVNRTRANQTSYLFGPSMAERSKTNPVIAFMIKLCRRRARLKEQMLHPLSEKSKWHIVRSANVRDAIKRLMIAEKKVMARKKFSRTIKVVRAVVRFIRVISIMSRDARHVLTEIHYFQEHQRLQTQLKIAMKPGQSGPIASRDVFDPNKYRFSSRFKISNEIRMILTKPWNLRSDAEVTKVVERLQELRCFVEYPVSFQHKLAKLAWLIEVAADLAVIREGHYAADFYFMLAGKARMIKLHGSPFLKERGTFHTLRLLKNGDAFGDESMSHPDSVRTYSVITTEKSILLSLSSVDYISMLQQTRDDEQAPEHIIFLSTLAFLKDFPKQKLIEEGDEYIRNYYLRAGSVISEALSQSEYIYVVKYGSCRVLVEMPPPGSEWSKKRRSTQELSTLRPIVSGSDDKLDIHSIGRHSSVLEFLFTHREEIGKNATAMAALKHMKEAHIDKEYEQTKAEAEKFERKAKKMFSSLRASTIAHCTDSELRTKYSFKTDAIRKNSSDENETNTENGGETVLSPSSSYKTSAVGLDFEDESEEVNSLDVKNSTSSRAHVEKHLSFVVSNSPQNQKGPRVQKSMSSSSRHAVGTTIDIDIDFIPAEESETSVHQISKEKLATSSSTIVPSGETSKVKLPRINSMAEKRNRELTRKQSIVKYSRWKLIRTMVKGDYIGHEWVDLNLGPFEPPDEEMSLVSDGCEVIMMNRAFLIKYLRKEL